LGDIEDTKIRPVVVLHSQDVHSFLSATYTFQHANGKVGELCVSQLVVISEAHSTSAPIIMSEIRVEFEGSMKPITLRHRAAATQSSDHFLHNKVTLTEATVENTEIGSTRTTLAGENDLTFFPGQTKIFEFSSLLREAGEATAVSAIFYKSANCFNFEFVQTFEASANADIWWGETPSVKRKIVRNNASGMTILPRPPKVELQFIGLQKQHYTNEIIKLQLEVVNGEDVDSIASLDIRLLGEDVPELTLRLAASSDKELQQKDDTVMPSGSPSGFPIGRIATVASSTVDVDIPPLSLQAIYELTVKVSYHLVSDMDTSIYKSMAIQLSVINPFEANYDFSPRIHPDPWPSIFTHDEGEDNESDTEGDRPHGLAQKWCLTCRYFSFASEDLVVEDLAVGVIGTNGNIQCSSTKATAIPEGGILVSPKSLDEAEFDIITHKTSLDDRGTATLDVSLAVKWRRGIEGSALNTTILAVPRLLVSSSEPRVLAAVSYSTTIPSAIHFDITIENPSNHFLTFNLSMEPSEKFAFSGIKTSNLQLVPLSRRTTRFRLLPFVKGDWIGPVRCVIKDRYFQKILKIAPTEGIRSDKEGLLVWVPPDEDDGSTEDGDE
jgi:hypothetical protein